MMKEQKFLKQIHFGLNLILLILIMGLWGSVYFVKGQLGAMSWAILKLFFAPFGVLALIIFLAYCMTQVARRKSLNGLKWVTGILLFVLSLPILMLLNFLPMAYPASIETSTPTLTIRSPFKEDVLVGWGGDSVKDNAPHVIWASERWAYDIVKAPESIGSSVLTDYGIYGLEVYAPISGEVIGVRDKEEDIPPNSDEFISLEGNYVYLKVYETGTYLLMNHFKKGSIEVKVGDRLEVGDYMGKIGNSGTTSEPHLHIHHQGQDPRKTWHPTFAEGLPLYFSSGQERVMPLKGEVLEGMSIEK